MNVKTTIIVAFLFFIFIWIVLFIHHERHNILFPHVDSSNDKKLPPSEQSLRRDGLTKPNGNKPTINFIPTIGDVMDEVHKFTDNLHNLEQTLTKNPDHKQPFNTNSSHLISEIHNFLTEAKDNEESKHPPTISTDNKSTAEEDGEQDSEPDTPENTTYRYGSKKGLLICNGQKVDSEVIYWRIVPGDHEFESPITPHHGLHHDRYLTFEYDNGGWNNIRMGVEALIVIAHAMGRTLVIPPQQHLYLLGANHQDKHDKQAHDEMGFEDFFDIDLLRSHKGFHIMTMEKFLTTEAATGGLKGILPPKNDTHLWGSSLWHYLNQVADAKPEWMGRFVAFPAAAHQYDNHSTAFEEGKVKQRLLAFGADRTPVFYEKAMRDVHHLHFPAHERHRLLQHHYAFAFFADPKLQSFYKRFVRDYMRYRDNIQCAGAELVNLVRNDARKLFPNNKKGTYYALHIRRGDFQYKDVKIGAAEILQNLKFPNGSAIIPRHAVVYISTDDPDGICKDCYVQRKPCTTYTTPKPQGCPEDTSWNAFTEYGWKIRFLRDYLKAGYLQEANPNTYGMIESIVCSRAKVFAGTYFSTFTGYIHRIRGYHGLGEQTYYHTKAYVFSLQRQKSIGHGFSREWRAGWTDDEGQLV